MKILRPAVVAIGVLLALPVTALSLEGTVQLVAQAMSADEIAWNLIRDSEDVEDFLQFIESFPESPFVTGARMKIRQLRGEPEEPSSSSEEARPSSSEPPPSSEPSSEEPPPPPPPSSEPSSSEPPPPPPPSSSESSSEELGWKVDYSLSLDVQRALKRLGCYGGNANGNWDAESREAVLRFNEAIGMDLGTEPSVRLMMEALSRQGPVCEPLEIESSEEPPPPVTRLYPLEVQRELKRVGCYTGPLDGDWGNGSRNALRKFNSATGKSLGTEPTGTVLDAVQARSGRVCKAAPPPPPPPSEPGGGDGGCFSFNGQQFCE